MLQMFSWPTAKTKAPILNNILNLKVKWMRSPTAQLTNLESQLRLTSDKSTSRTMPTFQRYTLATLHKNLELSSIPVPLTHGFLTLKFNFQEMLRRNTLTTIKPPLVPRNWPRELWFNLDQVPFLDISWPMMSELVPVTLPPVPDKFISLIKNSEMSRNNLLSSLAPISRPSSVWLIQHLPRKELNQYSTKWWINICSRITCSHSISPLSKLRI